MKKFLRSLALLAIIATPVLSAHTPAYAKTPASTQQAAEQQIQKALDTWLAAVSTGSSDAVMKLYATDAVLLPTLLPKVYNTPELRKEYFNFFTARENLKGTVNEQHIRVFGNIAVNSGFYTFTFTEKDKIVTVPARFSFVYQKTPQGWLIVDHHSSRLPEAQPSAISALRLK